MPQNNVNRPTSADLWLVHYLASVGQGLDLTDDVHEQTRMVHEARDAATAAVDSVEDILARARNDDAMRTTARAAAAVAVSRGRPTARGQSNASRTAARTAARAAAACARAHARDALHEDHLAGSRQVVDTYRQRQGEREFAEALSRALGSLPSPQLAGARRVVERYRQRRQAAAAQARVRPPVPQRLRPCSFASACRARSLMLRPQVPPHARENFGDIIGRMLDRLHGNDDRDLYAEGIQALWPTHFQPVPAQLAPIVDEAVTLTCLVRDKAQGSWSATEELRYYNTLLLMPPAARKRARLLVEQLWLATTVPGAMEDLTRLSAPGPEAGAFIDERRRFVRYAPPAWKKAFAERSGEDRETLLSYFPPRVRDVAVPDDTAFDDSTVPDVPSPLRRELVLETAP